MPPPKAEHISEFKKLYRKRYGVELTDTEALNGHTDLLVIAQYVQVRESGKAKPDAAGPSTSSIEYAPESTGQAFGG